MSASIYTPKNIEAKTIASGLAGLLVGAAIAVLNGLSGSELLGSLPPWAQALLTFAVPTILSSLMSYQAKHTSRPDLREPVGVDTNQRGTVVNITNHNPAAEPTATTANSALQTAAALGADVDEPEVHETSTVLTAKAVHSDESAGSIATTEVADDEQPGEADEMDPAGDTDTVTMAEQNAEDRNPDTLVPDLDDICATQEQSA